MSIRPLARPTFALLALACTLSVAGRAQIEGDLVPYAGLYLPTTSVMYQGPRQKASATLGVRATLWLLHWWGIEGTVNYAPSSLTGPKPVSPSSAYVIARSAKLLVRLNSPGANTVFHLGAGPSRVRYGGPAYRGCSDVHWQVCGSTVVGCEPAADGLRNWRPLLSARLQAGEYRVRGYFPVRRGGKS